MPTKITATERENPLFKELTSILGNGFILSLLTIKFFSLEYILPIVGASVMFYGCYVIRAHNKYFRRASLIAMLRVFLTLINFLLEWTFIYTQSVLPYIQIGLNVILVCLLFTQLNLGFSKIYEENHLPYHNSLCRFLFLYLCTVISTFLTIKLGVVGALISLLLLLINVIYVALSFYRIGEVLSHSNATVEVQSISNQELQRFSLLGMGYLIILVLVIFLSNKGAFFQSTSTKRFDEETTGYIETQNLLHSLGMDTDYILLLDTDELKELASVTDSEEKVDSYKINGGELELTIYNFKRTSDYRMYIYYRFTSAPSNRLFHILECEATNLTNINTLSSLCVFDEDNTTKEIPTIQCTFNKSNNPYSYQKIPNDGTNLRGYLAFNYTPLDSAKKPNMMINYYYQVSIFNLPYVSIVDYMNRHEEHSTSYVHNKKSMIFDPK